MLNDNLLRFSNLLENNITNNNHIHSATQDKQDKQKKQTIEKKDYYITDEEDKLFWYFYIILNGFKTYEYEKHALFKIEKDFKIAAIEKLRKQKALLKKNKLRLTEVEDELLNHSNISLKGLYALCLLYDINIIYVWDRKYFYMNSNPEEKTHVIEKRKNIDNYLCDDNIKIINFTSQYWKIENISKPLKGFSVYSLGELIDICNKLNISCKDERNKKKTKKMMYEDILKNL